VFLGGSRDALSSFARTLLTCGKALTASGVLVPRSGRAGNKATGATHQALASPKFPGWADLQAETAAAEAETVLLVMPAVLKARAPGRREAILERLSSVADEIVTVSVIADQLTMINEAYLHQVTTWRSSKRLDQVAPTLIENEMFDHERYLRPWYDDSQTAYHAVPLPEFDAGHPVVVVLRACGIELVRPPAAQMLPSEPRLGPIGVEAARLLATYARSKLPRLNPKDPAVVTVNRSAVARAEKLGWCAEPFWGWNRRAADQVLARFDASNHRFAQRVWGTAWTIPYPMERPSNRVDFLDLDVQFVDQVQRYVMATTNRLKRERAAAS
jgi:hypothetical protein